MQVIKARNVDIAYRDGVDLFLNTKLAVTPSRAGDVLEFPEPVTTCYEKPCERILWAPRRDCNPFFHLFESLWMLAGRNDAEYLVRFNKKMADFAEEGGMVYHGAYGYRWRQWFGFDQIEEAVALLARDPMTRRCVITMWSPLGDMVAADGGAGGMGSLDLPCNLMIKLEARRGRLDMIVYNRSNDMIWGAFGANAVHMSFLQQFIAECLGIPVGRYWQVSGNFHVYANVWKDKVGDKPEPGWLNPYISNDVTTAHIVKRWSKPEPLYCAQQHLRAIEDFVNDHNTTTDVPFLNDIAAPLSHIWDDWKQDRAKGYHGIVKLSHDSTNDWITACRMWMERRVAK